MANEIDKFVVYLQTRIRCLERMQADLAQKVLDGQTLTESDNQDAELVLSKLKEYRLVLDHVLRFKGGSGV